MTDLFSINVFSIHDKNCPVLFNPFVGTNQPNKIKAWDIFALQHCDPGQITTTIIRGGGIHTIKKYYKDCCICGVCITYSQCPTNCVLPTYFDIQTPTWPTQLVALSAQSIPNQKKNTNNGSIPNNSLGGFCKQMLKKNKKKLG